MKPIWIILSLFFFTLMISCDPAVVFNSPQPEGVEIQDNFDPEFRGTFMCESDSSIVVVDTHIVYKRHWYDFAIPKERVEEDPNIIRSGDLLYIKDKGKCAIYKVQNDSIFGSLPLTDTLFMMDGKTHVLKSYKGHQILSLKMNEGKYEVAVLSLDEDLNIQLKYATLPGELEQLEQITPVEDISHDEVEQYMIRPTRMEFDEILRQEIVFETCEYFRRVSVPNSYLFF